MGDIELAHFVLEGGSLEREAFRSSACASYAFPPGSSMPNSLKLTGFLLEHPEGNEITAKI